MESLENWRYLSVFLTVCDNPSKGILNTLQFAHVETGHTPEERVAVIRATAHQSMDHQDNSLICQILSNPPEITHLNETWLANIADIISKGEIGMKPIHQGCLQQLLDP